MSDTASAEPTRLSIRKYPNRRYYDASRSRHVTLEEIYALIRDGNEIQVTDSRSGQDITAKVLAQIIIELDPFKLGVFPVPLLHRLLQSNERAVSDFARRYFEQMLTSFLDSQRDLQQYWQGMMGIRSPVPTLADWTRVMWSPLAGGGPPPAPARPAPVPPEDATPAVQPAPNGAEGARQEDMWRELEAMRGQLESLLRRLASPRGPGRPGRKKSR